MSEPRRKRIEDAVITALRALVTSGLVRAVEAYAGEMQAGDLDDVRKVLLGRAPALLISTGPSRPERAINSQLSVRTMRVEVFVISNSMRSNEDRTRGAAGIYEMLEAVEGLMLGWSPGITGVSELGDLGNEPLIRTPDLYVWLAEFQVRVTISANPPAAGTAMLEIQADHKLIKDDGTLTDTIVSAVTTLDEA